MAPKDASEGGFGIQQGDVRVVAACYKIHQYQPNKETGAQMDPFPALALTYQLMVDGKKEGDPELVTYKAGKLGKFAPSTDGEDPVGQDVDDEGPFLVSLEDGAAPNKKGGLMLFTAELVKWGFKESVLEEGDASALVGLEGHVTTKKMPGIDGGKEYGVLVFDKITSRPYEKKKKAAAADEDEVPAKKGAGKKAAADDEEIDEKPKKATKSDDDGEKDPKELLTAILKKLVAKMDEEGKGRKELKKDVLARVISEPSKLQKAVLALFDDDDEMKELRGECGFKMMKDGTIKPVPEE
jgi:hypothetical protein